MFKTGGGVLSFAFFTHFRSTGSYGGFIQQTPDQVCFRLSAGGSYALANARGRDSCNGKLRQLSFMSALRRS